jgi:hypothetical protein
MQGVDIRMLSLVFIIIQSLIVTVTFGVATSNFRGMNRATTWWASGFLLRSISFVLIFLRDRIPDFFSIPLANALLLAGLVLIAWGIEAYSGQRLHYGLGLAWIVVSLVLAIVTYMQPSYNIRAFIVSILHMVIYGGIAVKLMRLHGDGVRLQQTMIAVLFLCSAVAMGTRSLLSILGPVQNSLFVSTPPSAIGFLESFLMPICVAIGLLSMLARKTQVERERTIGALEAALAQVKTLSGLLPICSSCKKIRDENGHWQEVENYVGNHSEVDFSHGICPECAAKLYPDFLAGTGKPE